jgi:polysaccharide deacetylase family protein (PEP-CTERM system associated)
VTSVIALAPDIAPPWERTQASTKGSAQLIISFDVEEHDRIEAAAGLTITAAQRAHYCARLEPSTRWVLDQLATHQIKATFFLVGQIARHNAGLIRAIHLAGHEVASHGWDHRRLHHFTPVSFHDDVRQSKDALEQITGEAVVGYRAPTFSLVRQTAWAIDILAGLGMLYDSSIYPVRHDRYGIPQAPRGPFWARGTSHSLLEIPPVTLRLLNRNVPIGGGGYFRLLPLFLLERALRQVEEECHPAIAMLYFHPWEFDPRQARLPLTPLNRFRTYVGIFRSRARLAGLLARYAGPNYARAKDIAKRLVPCDLPTFELTSAAK